MGRVLRSITDPVARCFISFEADSRRLSLALCVFRRIVDGSANAIQEADCCASCEEKINEPNTHVHLDALQCSEGESQIFVLSLVLPRRTKIYLEV